MSKDKARRAGEIILEGAHKLSQQEVPAWMDKYFEKTWEKYDQNKEGYLRYEEAFTFMRALIGQKNQFKLAPGSISDVYSGGNQYKLDSASEFTPVGHV